MGKKMAEAHDCCNTRTKKRDEKEARDLIHRLNRIEGQVRGIRGMIEKDAYCPDVLTQVAATRSALNSFAKVLLQHHVESCVTNDLMQGHTETIGELTDTIARLLK